MITRHRRFGGLIVAALVATAALTFTAAPAWADAAAESAKGGSDSCWLNADTGESRCFADVTALRQAIDGASVARATFTLAILYENSSYGGAGLVVTSSSSTYCATSAVTYNTMPAGWNDRVSSLATYYGCSARLYDSPNLVTFLGNYVTSSSLGGNDNRTSSFQIT